MSCHPRTELARPSLYRQTNTHTLTHMVIHDYMHTAQRAHGFCMVMAGAAVYISKARARLRVCVCVFVCACVCV